MICNTQIYFSTTAREQVAISKSIDNILKLEKSEDKSRVKILLLGNISIFNLQKFVFDRWCWRWKINNCEADEVKEVFYFVF